MTTQTTSAGPYRGILPFRYVDRHLFFGREQFLEEFLAQILAFRLVILFGRSGAGKSSLINAGLIPALEKEGLGFDRLRVGSEAATPLIVDRIPRTERQDGDFLPSVLRPRGHTS